MPNINSSKYLGSFTSGALLYEETSSIIDIIINDEIADNRAKIINENLLRLNSEASRKRVFNELSRRVRCVPPPVWTFFKEIDEKGQKLLLYYVCLKTYHMLYDFQTEVVLEKFRMRDLALSASDIEKFLMRKTSEHPEIENWSQSTREKLKSTILTMLRQSYLLKSNTIHPPVLPFKFWWFFIEIQDAWFLELALLNQCERNEIYEAIHQLR